MADVTFTVDGKKLTAPAGTLLIEACRKAGIEIPAYSTVAGVLPATVPSAKFEINVVTPGMIRIRLNSTKGLELFLDGVPVGIKEILDLDLKLGVHQFKVEIDGSRRGSDGLRVEVEESPGSAGRVHIVGGK